jgi:hypothetical protein
VKEKVNKEKKYCAQTCVENQLQSEQKTLTFNVDIIRWQATFYKIIIIGVSVVAGSSVQKKYTKEKNRLKTGWCG